MPTRRPCCSRRRRTSEIAPASLTKLMTMAVVFDALKAGQLSLVDTFTVSEHAWRTGGAPAGGTTMFAKLGSMIKVRDLIRGAIIQSSNDSCIVLAEGIAGSEGAFADRMNAEAEEARHDRIALHHSDRAARSQPVRDGDRPGDARPLPDRQFSRLLPDLFEPSFTWNGIKQDNRDPLPANIGGDGLALGGTDQAGYGMVGSATRSGQRLIMVVAGLASDKQRTDEARKLLDWGFRSFEKVTLFAPNDVIAQAAVFGGAEPTVALVSKDALEAFLPRGSRDGVAARVVYQGPVRAPIIKGQAIGRLEVSVGNQLVKEAPLYAADDVAIGSLPQRAYDALRELVAGWL